MKRYHPALAIVLTILLAASVSCTGWWRRRAPEMVPDTVRVTNPYIDLFMSEVEYTDNDHSVSHILKYPGGGPGEADIPPAVHLSWEQDSAAVVRVQERNRPDSTRWSWDYKVPTDSSCIDIINLVPQRDYEYYVLGSEGDTLNYGRFYTEGTLHHVFLRPGVRNARDLGGWKTLDGRTVAYRKLYRGARIIGDDGTSVYINAEGREDACAAGIGAELDLRDEGTMPSYSPLGSGVTFYAPGFPLGGSVMLGQYQARVAQCFKFIVKSLRDGRGVFFHCSAGRDRTGTMAALLLGTLGVSEGDIGKEYELTYFAPRGYSMYGKTRINGIRNSCWYIRKNYGGREKSFQECCENYLRAIGVSQEEIDEFKQLALE